MEEEEDYEPKGKEETSSDEDEVPLPQPGDMHVEFKKSSPPDRVKKPKIEFILIRLQRIYNFLLLHAMLSTVLGNIGLYYPLLYYFLGLTY